VEKRGGRGGSARSWLDGVGRLAGADGCAGPSTTLRSARDDEFVVGWSEGLRLEAFEVFAGFVVLGEEAFFGLELAGVDAAATGFDADGVF
jgi:hypothetical protein